MKENRPFPMIVRRKGSRYIVKSSTDLSSLLSDYCPSGFVPSRTRKSEREQWEIKNNDELVMSYHEGNIEYDIALDWYFLTARYDLDTFDKALTLLVVLSLNVKEVEGDERYMDKALSNIRTVLKRANKVLLNNGLEAARSEIVDAARLWAEIEKTPLVDAGIKSKRDHSKAGKAPKKSKGILDAISGKLKENPEMKTRQIWSSFPEYREAEDEFEYDYDAEFLIYRDDDRLFQENMKGEKRSISYRTFETYCADARKMQGIDT